MVCGKLDKAKVDVGFSPCYWEEIVKHERERERGWVSWRSRISLQREIWGFSGSRLEKTSERWVRWPDHMTTRVHLYIRWHEWWVQNHRECLGEMLYFIYLLLLLSNQVALGPYWAWAIQPAVPSWAACLAPRPSLSQADLAQAINCFRSVVNGALKFIGISLVGWWMIILFFFFFHKASKERNVTLILFFIFLLLNLHF